MVATAISAGKTLNQGLEGALGFDIGAGWSMSVNATYIPTAKFNNTKIVGGIDRNGNRLPYAPELTSNVVLSYMVGSLKTISRLPPVC